MKIKNWDKWQTYRQDRGAPPWIKVHRNLMSNSDWVGLSDAEKGQLVSMWIVAADKGGHLPDDPLMIRKMCILDGTPDINKFKRLGFIDAKRMPRRRQPDAPETETETETEVEKNIVEFDDLWDNYPHKQGKKGATHHFKASVTTEEDSNNICTALRNYLLHLKANTWKRPMNGSTWFNNWHDWVDWVEPDAPVEQKHKTISQQLDELKEGGNGMDKRIDGSESKVIDVTPVGFLAQSGLGLSETR